MKDLLETYPKAALVVKQWLLGKMLDSLNDDKLPENFKEFVKEQGISDEKVSEILKNSPRALFDVFDEHKVFIEISINFPGELFFSYAINNIVGKNVYKTRKEAEYAATSEAFELLNNKL